MLQGCRIVIDIEAIAHQDAGKIRTQCFRDDIPTSTALHAIDRGVEISQNPQEKLGAADPPTRFITMHNGCLAKSFQKLLVVAQEFIGESVAYLRQSPRRKPESQQILQN